MGCPTLPARMRASATQRLDQDLKFQPTPIIRRFSSNELNGDEEGFVALLLLFFGWKLLWDEINIYPGEQSSSAPGTRSVFVIFRAELFRFLSTTYVNGM